MKEREKRDPSSSYFRDSASYMFVIDMGDCDIVLGVEWLHTLGPILMDFKELTMQFQQEGQRYQFQGLTIGSPEIINSHCMENILKKDLSVLFLNSIPFKRLRHLGLSPDTYERVRHSQDEISHS
jgi:hypothetical protein